MATSLDIERAEQKRWRPRPEWAHVDRFDKLVVNEFLSADEQHARQAGALRHLVRFVSAEVPYYREVFRRLGFGSNDIQELRDLVRLPVLTKLDVQDRAKDLRPRALPPGQGEPVLTESSGTTGRPTQVVHTDAVRNLFRMLKQREMRWFRFDPSATLAAIRLPGQLPPRPDGQLFGEGVTCRMSRWRLVGRFFETGPYVAYAVTNPLERQMEWLERHQPAYLTSYPESLEHLALAYQETRPPASLRALLSISEQLTPQMRRCIERTFGVPLHQNYGLNEAGLVASRCPDGGRYHVHTEHCLVEIVDEEGMPCPPGQTGRVLVTMLSNPAMPLIRYDTDDLAEAVGGPCPCGRTLPSFGAVVGRYSRIAFLPEGTLEYVGAVREALESMPRHLSRNLRRFQMHQFRNGSFELRLAVAAPLPAEFSERIRQAWRAAVELEHIELHIREVDEIPRPPGGKLQDFTSDFMPGPDGGPASDDSPNPG